MEKQVQEPAVQTTNTSGDVEKKSETVRNADAVLEKNRELLAEIKNLKGKNQEFQSKLQSYEEEKMVTEGKKDELVDSLRERLTAAERKLEEKDQLYSWDKLTSQIQTAAMKKGCHSPEKLIKLLPDSALGKIQVGDDLNLLLEEAEKDNPFLFKKHVHVSDLNPGGKVQAKPVSEMSASELRERYRKINGL